MLLHIFYIKRTAKVIFKLSSKLFRLNFSSNSGTLSRTCNLAFDCRKLVSKLNFSETISILFIAVPFVHLSLFVVYSTNWKLDFKVTFEKKSSLALLCLYSTPTFSTISVNWEADGKCQRVTKTVSENYNHFLQLKLNIFHFTRSFGFFLIYFFILMTETHGGDF